MGIGDLFLIAFIYLNLGAMQGLAAMLVTIYLATIIGLGYAVIRRKLKGLIIPLAPFLFFSWLLITVFPEIGSALLSLYMF
jgi:prepilin signal peptidase PulO-like enzyme (type II secretory pathway)